MINTAVRLKKMLDLDFVVDKELEVLLLTNALSVSLDRLGLASLIRCARRASSLF
jgi:hypothetical protein